jgi:hypothetical protein
VSLDQTQQVIDHYFEVANGDFAKFYLDKVTRAMVNAEAEMRGAAAVRAYVIAPQAQMPTCTLGGLSSQIMRPIAT